MTRIRAPAMCTFPIDPAIWETITDGMAGALDASMGGTAFASHLDNIDFAGKTGTAQVVNHSAGTKSLARVPTRANAWFVGIAPRRNPDIAVVVLTEHGGWGSGVRTGGGADHRGLRG